MLKQRLLTAAVLIAALAALLFAAPARWFDAVLLAIVAVGSWEWARLNTNAALLQSLCVGLTLVLSGILWIWPIGSSITLWAAATLLWLLGAGAALLAGVRRWHRVPLGLRLAAGVLLLTLAWAAASRWRGAGINALLSVLMLVWAADTGAYFAGRRWGQHKLAPAISPGKTWEGVAGGLLAVILVALLWLALEQQWAPASASLYARLRLLGPAGMVAALLFLVAVSISGDLFESLVKRSAGVKDSSALLPGHGGVLDRIDALLPVLLVAWLLVDLAQGAVA